MQIAGRRISVEDRPYLIAELSGNHNQSLDRAFEIVDAAAKAGADALKLQTYTADTITLDADSDLFRITDPNSPWHNRRLHDLYEEAHLPWDWHAPIMERAAGHGMHCFSSVFDDTSVDFLEGLGVPAYKIASFECTDLPLIAKVASTGKPLIISTGMATIAEIDEAVTTARDNGCRDIAILKCTSTYPATPENTNILTIPNMRQTFGVEVGLSDHTMGCGVAVGAVTLGATVVEKHLTLRRAEGGVDSTFSLEPEEFAMLRAETERAWQSLGTVRYGGTKAEEGSKVFRRSIFVSADMAAGDEVTHDTVRIVRPGNGLEPRHIDTVLGMRVNRDVAKGTPLTWDLIG